MSNMICAGMTDLNVAAELDRALTRTILAAVVTAAAVAGGPPTVRAVCRALTGSRRRPGATESGGAPSLGRFGAMEIREAVEILEERGLVEKTVVPKNHLALTPQGEEYLRGRIDRATGVGEHLLGRAAPGDEVYEALRALRARLAREEGRSPGYVLSNRALRALASKRPARLEDLEGVPGIAVKKALRYGQAILQTIASVAVKPAADPLTWDLTVALGAAAEEASAVAAGTSAGPPKTVGEPRGRYHVRRTGAAATR